MPQQIQQIAVTTTDASQVFNIILFVAVVLITVVSVVVVNEAQRNIPVQYARMIHGPRTSGGASTHLPLRLLQAGVIPIIFAISVIFFPPLIAQFLVKSGAVWLQSVGQWVINVFQPTHPLYSILYFILVFGFTYFYTAVVFKPEQIAENLQKQGGFIPGIRPGRTTVEFLSQTMNRVVLPGAVFLSLIAVMPMLLQNATGSQLLVIGGTSVLIVVSVVIESIRQINAQLVMRDYDEL